MTLSAQRTSVRSRLTPTCVQAPIGYKPAGPTSDQADLAAVRCDRCDLCGFAIGASTRRLLGALTEGREAASSKPLTTASTPALRFRRARAVRHRRANAAVLVCRQPPEPAIASTGALPSSLLSLRRPLDRAGRRRRTSAWPVQSRQPWWRPAIPMATMCCPVRAKRKQVAVFCPLLRDQADRRFLIGIPGYVPPER